MKVESKKSKPSSSAKASIPKELRGGRLRGTIIHEKDIVSPLGAKLWKATK